MLRLKLVILAVATTEILVVALVYLMPAAKFIASVNGSWHITIHNGFICSDTLWKRSMTPSEFLKWAADDFTMSGQGARPVSPPVMTAQTTLKLCPVLMIFVALANIPAYMLGKRALVLAQSNRRRAQKLCMTCGYDLAHLASNACPECGCTFPSAGGAEV